MEYRKRSCFQVMLDVITALFVREMKTRFGSTKLGYFWVIAAPVSHILVFTVVFSISGRSSVGGLEIPVFILTGIFPYTLFSTLVTSLSQGIESNRALLVYRQVEPIDPILTRLLIELTVYVVTTVVLLFIFFWLGYNVLPENILQVLGVNAILVLLGFGIGLSLCSAVLYTKESSKLIGIVLQPLYFVSGVFFSTALVPIQFWPYLKWNPMLHLIELHRMAFSSNYITEFPNWQYPAMLALFFLVLGLMLYKVNHYRFIAS